jgi:hypothetical protein
MALDPNKVNENNGGNKKFPPSPYVKYGIQEVKITGAEIKTASTGTPKIIYNIETVPVKAEGFQGANGAEGQVGSVHTSWCKPGSAQEQEAFGQLLTFAQKAGVDTTTLPVFNDGELQKVLDTILPMIKGKYVRVKLTAEFYPGKDKEGNPKDKFVLHFARFKFAESMDIAMKDTTLSFDENSEFDMDKRKLKEAADVTTDAPASDLPF